MLCKSKPKKSSKNIYQWQFRYCYITDRHRSKVIFLSSAVGTINICRSNLYYTTSDIYIHIFCQLFDVIVLAAHLSSVCPECKAGLGVLWGSLVCETLAGFELSTYCSKESSVAITPSSCMSQRQEQQRYCASAWSSQASDGGQTKSTCRVSGELLFYINKCYLGG